MVTMKNLLLILMPSFLLAIAPDKALLDYQKRYTLCQGKSNYQIVACLLNGQINYSRLRGDKPKYHKVDTNSLKEAETYNETYAYAMSLLPRTRRYEGLIAYLDYLYSITAYYLAPEFRGDKAEDTMRIKRVFNLLQNANLIEDTNRTPAFDIELLKYQKRHGLAVDGEIGPRTKKALKQSIQQMIIKVKKNLEIERVTTPKGDNYILVNIPEFKMHYYENFEPVLSMKVVVGKRKMRTPVFSRKMKYIVKNPQWNVPDNLYKNEYAHLSKEALRKQGLIYNAKGKLYQPSGSKNALGVVKFLFPNKYNVYMHDTPSKYLFNKTVRAYSHGCIRLEKPLDLLHAFGHEYDTKKQKWITVKNQIPVYVEYHTVWVDDEGIVQFRPDIYGYEKKLFR